MKLVKPVVGLRSKERAKRSGGTKEATVCTRVADETKGMLTSEKLKGFGFVLIVNTDFTLNSSAVFEEHARTIKRHLRLEHTRPREKHVQIPYKSEVSYFNREGGQRVSEALKTKNIELYEKKSAY